MTCSSPHHPLAEARQLVLVITDHWEAMTGTLQCYERTDLSTIWRAIGDQASVVVGRNGLAWGKGLHVCEPEAGSIKQEGDGKAPAGVFRLTYAFGYAPANQAINIKLPYLHLTSSIECIDDAHSSHYNRLVNRSQIAAPDWNSAEQMLRPDERYRWGVVVAHNSDPPRAGAGSCIFLHIWENAFTGTAGCTAMEARRMEELLSWLDPLANPVLVQLPKNESLRRQHNWGLPEHT